jgi:hypothetical protein
MEVENLFQHIAALTVTRDFPILIQRIIDASGDDFPYGAEILTHVQPTSESPCMFRDFNPTN